MAKERNLKREYETSKARGETIIGIKVVQQIKNDFDAKCIANGTTKNALLKQFILEYTYGPEQAAEMAKSTQ